MADLLHHLSLKKREGKVIIKKIPLSQEVRRSVLLLIFTLLAITVILSIAFLLNRSQETQKGYIFEREQLDLEQLELRSGELEDKMKKAQSMNTIQNSEKVKQMKPAEKIEYVEEKKE